ncbi:DUF397 domain-containing protein [Streptomyces olivoreticuli]|uniref:DUF397 domain-containing protein n=1 Tax=Streptomyces olivoreticuli TaxID=68246 RepID=UPI000E263739|nr:DUF397 domain-containing protein [Streptomyces olivoreticuli]
MNRKEDLYAVDLTGATWRKSSRSNGGNQCVEVTDLPGLGLAVRDSKDPDRGDLRYYSQGWEAFCASVINGTL